MNTIQAQDGEPLFIDANLVNQQVKALFRPLEITVQGKPSRVVIAGCSNVEIRGLNIYGGDTSEIHCKRGLLEISNCHNVKIKSPIIKGAVTQDDKQHWPDNVPNGIIIGEDCRHVQVFEGAVNHCHIGIQDRGYGTSISHCHIDRNSGDHIQALGQNSYIGYNTLAWLLGVIPYGKSWHHDNIQLWATDNADTHINGVPVMRNVIIEHNTILNTYDEDVPWAIPVQVLLLSDGAGDNIQITHNKVFTSHPMLCLLNPVTNSKICDNTFEIVGELDDQPILAIEDRKGYGITPENNIIENNTITNAVKRKETDMHEGNEVDPDIAWDSEITSLRNTNAPAITEQDYVAAAERLDLSVQMVKSVSRVESRGRSYLNNGAVVMLYERHKGYKFCKERGVDVKAARRQVGDNIINRKPGGYKGEHAEYYRAKMASHVHDELGLFIALESASWGLFQIMGFHWKLLGYASPLAMVQDFHASEAAQLNAFCTFLENTGLVQHLRSAETQIHAGNWSEAMKHLNKFARGYNGKAHKNYHVKIANEYKRLADIPEPEMKELKKSRTIASGGTSAVSGLAGGSSAIGVVALVQDLRTEKDALQAEVDSLKADMAGGDVLVWVLLAVVLASNAGAIIGGAGAIYARVTDRLRGLN